MGGAFSCLFKKIVKTPDQNCSSPENSGMIGITALCGRGAGCEHDRVVLMLTQILPAAREDFVSNGLGHIIHPFQKPIRRLGASAERSIPSSDR